MRTKQTNVRSRCMICIEYDYSKKSSVSTALLSQSVVRARLRIKPNCQDSATSFVPFHATILLTFGEQLHGIHIESWHKISNALGHSGQNLMNNSMG